MIPSLHARLLAALCLTLWAAGAAAEFRIGVGSWDYELSGNANDRGREYDFRDDLELQTSGRRSLLVELETGPGGWPDFAASYTQMGAAGQHTETFTPLGPLGVPLPPVTQDIVASADFDDYEITARWPWTWGKVHWGGGLTLRRLTGTVVIEDSEQTDSTHEDYDVVLPQLHLRARWPLGKRLALSAAGYGVEYDGSRAVEWRAGAELRLKALLLEAGWQEKRYVIDVDDFRLDAQLDGALLRAGFVWR